MSTDPDLTHLPDTLREDLATLYGRLADLYRTGLCDTTPLTAVLDNTRRDLDHPVIRAAAEEIVRKGHEVGMRLEIRGSAAIASQFVLGGSPLLAAAVGIGRVTYRPVRIVVGDNGAKAG